MSAFKTNLLWPLPWKYQFSWQWQLWCISHKSRKMELFGKQANLHKRKSEVKPDCIARKKEFLQHHLALQNQLYLIFVNNFLLKKPHTSNRHSYIIDYYSRRKNRPKTGWKSEIIVMTPSAVKNWWFIAFFSFNLRRNGHVMTYRIFSRSSGNLHHDICTEEVWWEEHLKCRQKKSRITQFVSIY